jgi:hypothetical protein
VKLLSHLGVLLQVRHVPHFDFVAMSALPSCGAGCLVPLLFVRSSLSLLSSKGTVISLVGNACMFLCLVIAIFGARDSWGGSFCNIFFDLWWSGGSLIPVLGIGTVW